MSRHRHAPGHEPTIETTSDDQLNSADRLPDIATHRAKRRSGRRAFLIAFAITLLLGSGIAYGAQMQHAHMTAASDTRHAGSATAVDPQQQPSAAAGPEQASPPAHPSPRPSATKTAKASASPRATSTTSKATKSSTTSSAERIIKAYLTGYSYFDNTPPGSVDISNPILHNTASGTGTYADPITVAVGHSLIGGRDVLDWPAGTRFYVPNLHKYFIAEDTCGDGSDPQGGPCHVGYPTSASTWLDLWIGGKGGTTSGSNACMDAITGVWSVVVNPPSGLATATGGVYGPGGCAKQYGNTVTRG